ncbi:MAG: pilus assembly protein PilM [Elusimicrobia bacterium]|nr:pilus assembly protein PilM [Elusimicrobiota bacterium]
MSWKKASGSLGIYFGGQVVNAVEVDNKKVVTSISIPMQVPAAADSQEKNKEEAALLALLTSEFKKIKSPSTPAVLSLPGKDFIIRTFELPVMPQDELNSAVAFEAKKYIPFKLEELMFDFHVQLDRINRRNMVLFAAIKRDVFTRHQFLLNQCGIKIGTVEYSAFSVLRLLNLLRVNDRGIIGLFNVDLSAEDEVDFLVLDNGYPLFSRDIPLTTRGGTDIPRQENGNSEQLIEKFKTEIRISADYYQRKFPLKRIEKVYFISGSNYRPILEEFVKEIGFPLDFIDVTRYAAEIGTVLNLGLLRSYGAALSGVLKTNFKLDVVNPKQRLLAVKKPHGKAAGVAAGVGNLAADIKINPKTVIVGLLICALAFLIGLYRLKPVEQEFANIISMRPSVTSVSVDLSPDELTTINDSYRKRLKDLEALIKKQLYITGLLDGIPRSLPDGVWLKELIFKKDDTNAELLLRGIAYAGDNETEMNLVNSFLNNLRGLPVFGDYFKDMSITSVEQNKTGSSMMTDFEINCKGVKSQVAK